jgi:hypothetical protein
MSSLGQYPFAITQNDFVGYLLLRLSLGGETDLIQTG